MDNTPITEWEFQHFIQKVGRTQRRKGDGLSFEESQEAMRRILDKQVTPMQLGAFLMMIRVREETPEEAAGFLSVLKARLTLPRIAVDIDWGCYAGKKRYLPWYLLALEVLRQQGYRIFLHGIVGSDASRIYTQTLMSKLGWPIITRLEDAEIELNRFGGCYISLENFCPELKKLMELREEIGLRSPMHSLSRMINPLNAKWSVHGVFHQGFDEIHQKTAVLGTDQSVIAFRGDGGEADLRPNMDTTIRLYSKEEGLSEFVMPKQSIPIVATEKNINEQELMSLWHDEINHEYGQAVVIHTLTMMLKIVKKVSVEKASVEAKKLWHERRRFK